MKIYLKAIFNFAFLLLLLISCNEEDKDKNDLDNFKNEIVNSFDIDTNKLHFYSYPSTNGKINIYANGKEIYAETVDCKSLPGCLLYSMNKEKSDTFIKISFNNSLDTSFKISNKSIYKIMIAIKDNKLNIFTNENTNIWTVEY